MTVVPKDCDNIALALDICEELGVENDQAIKGMRKMIPDPGALTVTKLSINNSSMDFVNAFAANDPQSTLKTWNIIFEYIKGSRKTAVFLKAHFLGIVDHCCALMMHFCCIAVTLQLHCSSMARILQI